MKRQQSDAAPRPANGQSGETLVREDGAITADEVAAFLGQHPDFFAEHPDLLESLTTLPAENGNGVVSLQRFLVERLID